VKDTKESREKQSEGFAHLFRPTYALANVGHPSYFVIETCRRYLRLAATLSTGGTMVAP
jgi:hypothetical protein